MGLGEGGADHTHTLQLLHDKLMKILQSENMENETHNHSSNNTDTIVH